MVFVPKERPMLSLSRRLTSKEEFYFTITEAFEEIRQSFAARSTLRYDKVPSLFRESYIFSGYRPVGKSFPYYIRSFFMLHNESMNVWTHFFGAFLLMREMSRFYEDFNATNPFDTVMVSIFAVCSILLHFVSAAAHLTHNHAEQTHCLAFYCDNAAVGISSSAFNLLVFSYSALPEHYAALQKWYLFLQIIGSVSLSTGVSFALAKYRRVYDKHTKLIMYVPTGIFILWGCSPHIYKFFRWSFTGYDTDFQYHYLYSILFFTIAAVFYTTYFPECHFPGQFDIFGHSHQLFHIFVTLSHASIIYAVRMDVVSKHKHLGSKRERPIPFDDIFLSFVVMILIDFMVMLFLVIKYRNINNKPKVK